MNKRVIDFYKNLGFEEKRMFNYLDQHILYVDCENGKSFIGCYPFIEDTILKKINLILPKGESLEDIVMCVHELGHFFSFYPYLNKSVAIDESCEIFPIAMERLFIESSSDNEIIDWFNHYQYDLINKALENEKEENVIGFLNHWDYIDFYKETSTLPELLDFKMHDFIDPYEELEEKAKIMLKKL